MKNANIIETIQQSGFSVIDIICFILLALALILGLIKGFGKGTVRSIANYSGLALAYFAGVPLSRQIIGNTKGIGNNFIFDLYFKSLPTTECFTKSLNGLDAIEKTDAMSAALGEIHIPTFFRGFFTSRALILDGSVGQALASSFTFLTITAICFLLLSLIAFILVKTILGKITGFVFGENGKNLLGRIAGMIKALVKTGFMILVVFAIIILINQFMIKADNTVLNDWLVNDLNLSDGSTFSIGRLFYNSANSVLNWISLR